MVRLGRRFPLLLLALLLVGAVCAHASQLRRLNLEDLTRRADRVFSGRCIDVRVGVDPDLGREATWITFAVGRAAKGTLPGRLTIKLLGDQNAGGPDRDRIEGLPRFRKGEQVVLFLYPDSEVGLTSPVGFGQGKFSLIPDPKGGMKAVNAFGNDGLLDRMGPGVELLRGPRGVDADALLDAVEVLTDSRRGDRP